MTARLFNDLVDTAAVMVMKSGVTLKVPPHFTDADIAAWGGIAIYKDVPDINNRVVNVESRGADTLSKDLKDICKPLTNVESRGTNTIGRSKMDIPNENNQSRDVDTLGHQTTETTKMDIAGLLEEIRKVDGAKLIAREYLKEDSAMPRFSESDATAIIQDHATLHYKPKGGSAAVAFSKCLNQEPVFRRFIAACRDSGWAEAAEVAKVALPVAKAAPPTFTTAPRQVSGNQAVDNVNDATAALGALDAIKEEIARAHPFLSVEEVARQAEGQRQALDRIAQRRTGRGTHPRGSSPGRL